MRKQVIASFLLATILVLTMPMLYTVHATQHHIDGEDYGYSVGIDPWYCECNHMVWEGDPEDTMVALGVTAKYTLAGFPWPPYVIPVFYWGEWFFEAQYGDGDVMMVYGMSVDACTSGVNHCYYTDYSEPVWGYPPRFPWYECYYVYLEAAGYTGLASSVEGSTTAAFYHPSDPPPFGGWWWIHAFTQNPPYHPDGHGWSFLYAHW